jgi:hypothetical protein
LRRVVRAGLSALRVVPPKPCSRTVKAGISATYDLHEYEDEKHEALELWAQP